MHLQLQISQQKIFHLQQNILKPYSVSRKNNEIVGITDILLDLQSVLHKLVEFIHVSIHKQLRSQISKRKSDTKPCWTKTADDFRSKPDNVWIRNTFLENLKKNLLVNRGKKFPDIALEHPARFRIIFTDVIRTLLKSVIGSASAFSKAARI